MKNCKQRARAKQDEQVTEHVKHMLNQQEDLKATKQAIIPNKTIQNTITNP